MLTDLEPGRPLLGLVERLDEEAREEGEHEAGHHLQHERVQPQVDGAQQVVLRLRQAAVGHDVLWGEGRGGRFNRKSSA